MQHVTEKQQKIKESSKHNIPITTITIITIITITTIIIETITFMEKRSLATNTSIQVSHMLCLESIAEVVIRHLDVVVAREVDGEGSVSHGHEEKEN